MCIRHGVRRLLRRLRGSCRRCGCSLRRQLVAAAREAPQEGCGDLQRQQRRGAGRVVRRVVQKRVVDAASDKGDLGGGVREHAALLHDGGKVRLLQQRVREHDATHGVARRQAEARGRRLVFKDFRVPEAGVRSYRELQAGLLPHGLQRVLHPLLNGGRGGRRGRSVGNGRAADAVLAARRRRRRRRNRLSGATVRGTQLYEAARAKQLERAQAEAEAAAPAASTGAGGEGRKNPRTPSPNPAARRLFEMAGQRDEWVTARRREALAAADALAASAGSLGATVGSTGVGVGGNGAATRRAADDPEARWNALHEAGAARVQRRRRGEAQAQEPPPQVATADSEVFDRLYKNGVDYMWYKDLRHKLAEEHEEKHPYKPTVNKRRPAKGRSPSPRIGGGAGGGGGGAGRRPSPALSTRTHPDNTMLAPDSDATASASPPSPLPYSDFHNAEGHARRLGEGFEGSPVRLRSELFQ
eukprot:Rhum_TRINITY_DN14316_c3_g1::Rhum_TRINITY_DN14316_c3_g1_i1::g.82345::m.82345